MLNRLFPIALAATFLTACDNDPTASAAFLTPTLPSVDFGRRDVMSAAVTRGIQIQNAGGTRSGALGVSITGPGAAGFRIDTAGSSCIGTSLAPNAVCNVAVRLDGHASGPVSATLIVGAPGGPQSALVAMSGVLFS